MIKINKRYCVYILKKLFNTTFGILLFLILYFNYSSAVTVDRILATANNEIITLSDYKKYVSKFDNIEDKEKVDEIILKSLIEENLILQEAKRIGMDASNEEIEHSIDDFQKQNNLSKEEFSKRLSDERISLNEYKKLLKDNIMSIKLIEKEINSKIIVTEEEIINYYNKNKNIFLQSNKKMQIKAIFLRISNNPTLTEITDLKIKSLKIYSEIKNAELFDKMVALYSDEPLKSRNGVLGEFGKGELMPSLEKEILSLKEEEISEPVWTLEGVYILKLSKLINESFTPIETIRDSIHTIIFEQKKKENYNEWIKNLWGNSSIQIKQQY